MSSNSRPVKTTTILTSTSLRSLPKVRKQNMDSLITSSFFQDYQTELDNEYELMLLGEENCKRSNRGSSTPNIQKHEHIGITTESLPQTSASGVTQLSNSDIIAQFLAEEGIVVPKRSSSPDVPAVCNSTATQIVQPDDDLTDKLTSPLDPSLVVETDGKETARDDYNPFEDLLCVIDEQIVEIDNDCEDSDMFDDNKVTSESSVTALDIDMGTEPLNLNNTSSPSIVNEEQNLGSSSGNKIRNDRADGITFCGKPVGSKKNQKLSSFPNTDPIPVTNSITPPTNTPNIFGNFSKDVTTLFYTSSTEKMASIDELLDASKETDCSFDSFFSWYELNSIDTLVSTVSSELISNHNSDGFAEANDGVLSEPRHGNEFEPRGGCPATSGVYHNSNWRSSESYILPESAVYNDEASYADLPLPKTTCEGGTGEVDNDTSRMWISSKKPYIDQRTYAIPTRKPRQRYHYFRFWLNWSTHKPVSSVAHHGVKSNVPNTGQQSVGECHSHFKRHRLLRWRR